MLSCFLNPLQGFSRVIFCFCSESGFLRDKAYHDKLSDPGLLHDCVYLSNILNSISFEKKLKQAWSASKIPDLEMRWNQRSLQIQLEKEFNY
jgi:hypothetical protein